MRTVVILLALLAAAKLGYSEYLFRVSTRDAVIGAYKEHAAEACRRDASSQALGLGPQAWSNPSSIRLVIGKSSLDVYPWQVDHVLWNARYRNPLLVLSTDSRGGTVYCEYDIVGAAATVIRM